MVPIGRRQQDYIKDIQHSDRYADILFPML